MRTFVGGAGGRWVGHLPKILTIHVDFVDGSVSVGFSLEAEEQLRGIPRQFGMTVNPETERVRRVRINDSPDAPLRTGRRRILQHVNTAAARGPLVVGVVDVDASVGMAFDKEQWRVEQLGGLLLPSRNCTDKTHREHCNGSDYCHLFPVTNSSTYQISIHLLLAAS